jgi:probable addiction module antidote protein
LKLTRVDSAEHLKTDADAAIYLADSFASNDPAVMTRALNTVVRARSTVSEVARVTGLSREGVTRALGEGGDPRISTFAGILGAVGLGMMITPKKVDLAAKRVVRKGDTIKTKTLNVQSAGRVAADGNATGAAPRASAKTVAKKARPLPVLKGRRVAAR